MWLRFQNTLLPIWLRHSLVSCVNWANELDCTVCSFRNPFTQCLEMLQLHKHALLLLKPAAQSSYLVGKKGRLHLQLKGFLSSERLRGKTGSRGSTCAPFYSPGTAAVACCAPEKAGGRGPLRSKLPTTMPLGRGRLRECEEPAILPKD